MNCAELDPYIKEFDSIILQRNPRLTDMQVEKEREKSFATWLRYRGNEQEEVDPNALEREVESDEEEESPDDEDEFEEDDEDDAELDISSAYMVRGGRSGRVSTSVGRGSTRIRSASPSTPVVPATGSASPSTSVVPATGTASPSTPGVRVT
ncbi:hypothetical protein Taro_003234, partial [Colocasia esculenta]|nr:hypothetical protein [Colocasia esculenta]